MKANLKFSVPERCPRKRGTKVFGIAMELLFRRIRRAGLKPRNAIVGSIRFQLANAALGVDTGLKVPSGDSKRRGPFMRWRSVAGNTHPLAIPLLGALSACTFGSLYWLVGVGGTPLHGAVTFSILYGFLVAVIFGIGGVFWCAVKLLAIRRRSSEQQR